MMKWEMDVEIGAIYRRRREKMLGGEREKFGPVSCDKWGKAGGNREGRFAGRKRGGIFKKKIKIKIIIIKVFSLSTKKIIN